ncbi:uncharacterized protein CBL_02117 [Carabus blaptoides fortunei]
MHTHCLKNYFTARKKHKIPRAPASSELQVTQCSREPVDDGVHRITSDVQCQLTGRRHTLHRDLVHVVDTISDEVPPITCTTWMDLMFSVVCVHIYVCALRYLDTVRNSSKMVLGWLATNNTTVYSTRRDPISKATNHDRRRPTNAGSLTAFLLACLWVLAGAAAASPDLDKGDRFLDKINEQSIAAVFNKVAYGSTTKRSIPDNAYAYTTLATPLLTTYRYSDGNQEWYRVDVKEPEPDERLTDVDDSNTSGESKERARSGDPSYGTDLEKDHVLPTSAPAADILKNNNNKHYNNPNRYNNDRLRPELPPGLSGTPSRYPAVVETVTEREPPPRTSTGYSVLRNVRPTKSMFGKEVPSYVPPSRSFFTPPLPPEYLNPFADKPTLRGTNSETYQNRRPIPPPSLMPKKDRIPFRPDLPPAPANESPPRHLPDMIVDNKSDRGVESRPTDTRAPERKKTLNTPSQNVHLDRVGEFYGLNRLHNESNFEYEPMVHIPSISRILSGSNGRKEDIPDVLLRTVTAIPNRNPAIELRPKHRPEPAPVVPNNEKISNTNLEDDVSKQAAAAAASAIVPKTPVGGDSIPYTKHKPSGHPEDKHRDGEAAEATLKHDTTTSTPDILNLPNVKVKNRAEEMSNATKAATSGHEIWHICWNVHVYLVVFLYVLLAVFSIVKLIRFERETHMFSKSYFLSVHLLLTAVCVLRIFYLAYDPYNVNGSFTNFTYDLLHNLPLSLLATTFAVLIVFLLKRTLNHLKVKTRPIFLVFFGLGHMLLCFCLNLAESFELFTRTSFMGLVCRFVYILLCWSLGLSYVYLYKIIKNVLAKKSQNLSEMCTQNISYASHITIAVALLFTLLGLVQLYGLFFIKVDRFTVPYHWILWGFELSVRVLEISIVTLLAIVVSLRMSQREKQNVGFPLFPCTTSDSSTDNIYPNNCSTNLNALNYSLRSSQAQYRQQLQQHQQELALENLPTDIVERPNLLLDKKSTLDRCYPGSGLDRSSESASDHDRGSAYEPPPPPVPPVVRGASFDRFERPNWGSQRFAADAERDTFPVRNFERADDVQPGSGHFERGSGRATRTFERAEPGDYPSGHFEHGSGRVKPYEKCRYYAKPKYDTDLYNNSTDDQHEPPKHMKRDLADSDEPNVYSEPLDVAASAEYERRHEPLDRADLERRSRTSWNNSGRRSTGRSSRKPTGMACRPHQAGVHTLPNQDTAAAAAAAANSMLVDENGFVRFRQLAGEQEMAAAAARKHHSRHHHMDVNHYSDA